MSVREVQRRLASMSLDKSLLTPPKPTALVTRLLEKNDAEHDIFFGKNHFHNHFPHTLLSQFALGAPEKRLLKEVDLEDYLNPIPQKQPTEITDENWTEYIGKDVFYPNYLEYFKRKITAEGVQSTVINYALKPSLLPSLVSGAVHPLIHLGFGLEFGSDIVVAEGLAGACVHRPAFAPVVDSQMYSQPAKGTRSLLEIADEIRKDHVFDDCVEFKSFPKSEAVLASEKATKAIKEYVMQWKADESPEGFANAWSELFELVTHFVGTSSFAPPRITTQEKYKDVEFRPLLDFFLMYCSVSSLLILGTR
jgi:Questin oxidase-like